MSGDDTVLARAERYLLDKDWGYGSIPMSSPGVAELMAGFAELEVERDRQRELLAPTPPEDMARIRQSRKLRHVLTPDDTSLLLSHIDHLERLLSDLSADGQLAVYRNGFREGVAAIIQLHEDWYSAMTGDDLKSQYGIEGNLPDLGRMARMVALGEIVRRG